MAAPIPPDFTDHLACNGVACSKTFHSEKCFSNLLPCIM